MRAVDYYWAKVDEALAKADNEKPLCSYFTAVALAYRMLAFGEAKFRSSWPSVRARDSADRSVL